MPHILTFIVRSNGGGKIAPLDKTRNNIRDHSYITQALVGGGGDCCLFSALKNIFIGPSYISNVSTGLGGWVQKKS